MPGQDSSEVIQTRGLLLYTEPYSSANVMPVDSAWGTAPGGAWVEKGYTDGGFNVNATMSYEDVTVDQNIYPIFTIGTSGDIHFVVNLAQVTAANLKEALGSQGTLSTVAAGSGTRGHTDLAITGDVTVSYITAYMDIRHPGDGEGLRPVIWKGQCRGNPTMQFAPGQKALLPLDIQAYPDTVNASRVLTWRDVIAALP